MRKIIQELPYGVIWPLVFVRVCRGEHLLNELHRRLRPCRFHPRFGFEELLAARLASSGRERTAESLPDDPTPEPIPFPLAPPSDGGRVASGRRRRSLVAGGAIACSGLAIQLLGV